MPIYKADGTKDGLQKYRVRVNYTDEKGNARQFTRIAYGRENARALERELSTNSCIPTGHAMSVSDLYLIYLRARESEVRETTLAKFRQNTELHILTFIGDVRIDKLTPHNLNEWKIKLNASDLSLRTKQNVYSCMHTLLNWAVQTEYIQNNPLNRVPNFRSAIEPRKEMLFYTPDEYRRFISAAYEYAESRDTLSAWDYYVFFSLAFFTGMRKGEMTALQWRDIEYDLIHITKSLNQKLKGGDRITPPKNKSSVRDIRVPSELHGILQEHQLRQMDMPDYSEKYYVCGGARPLRDTTIEKHNAEYAKTAGVKKIRIHDFRHSHASLLINAGINIQAVSRRLGHATVTETLNTYSHLYPSAEEEILNVLDSYTIRTREC